MSTTYYKYFGSFAFSFYFGATIGLFIVGTGFSILDAVEYGVMWQAIIQFITLFIVLVTFIVAAAATVKDAPYVLYRYPPEIVDRYYGLYYVISTSAWTALVVLWILTYILAIPFFVSIFTVVRPNPVSQPWLQFGFMAALFLFQLLAIVYVASSQDNPYARESMGRGSTILGYPRTKKEKEFNDDYNARNARNASSSQARLTIDAYKVQWT